MRIKKDNDEYPPVSLSSNKNNLDYFKRLYEEGGKGFIENKIQNFSVQPN